ncbi:hypothetical protein RRG08_023654 [Elysia crispata]|uniref:Uncharacterized protein n=1 Tax=Elysia crispata TaxID=231223 RepID=A0AAE0XSL3_9GAST|nr:hypothetical protein RRG08_023654 [Elysia crispata]
MNLFTQQNIFKQTQRGMFFDVFINFIFYHGLKRSLYPKSCGDIDIITICCPLCVIPIQFQVAYVQHLGSFPLSSSPFEIDSNTYSPIFHGSEVSEILWNESGEKTHEYYVLECPTSPFFRQTYNRPDPIPKKTCDEVRRRRKQKPRSPSETVANHGNPEQRHMPDNRAKKISDPDKHSVVRCDGLYLKALNPRK